MSCSLVNNTCGTGGWSGPLPGDPDTNALLTAVPAFGGIDVSWTAALVNPHAVAHTLLYRSSSPDFETAVRIAVVGGTFFYDKLESQIRQYYWIQIVSVNGTYGEVIGPASAIPRLSIDATIEALTSKIDKSVLAESLKQDIDNITVLGADLMQEINDRIAANELLGAALQTAQNGVDQAFSLIEEEIQQRTTAYNVLIQAINTMAAQINDTQAAIQNESLLRIEGDEALAQQTSLLYAAKSELQAAVNQVSQAIIDGDDALAIQISTVQTALNDSVASVQTSMQTQIDTVNGKVTQIGALYTAKVSVNGLIGGFGVYNDGTEVQAGFDVDTFWVGRTSSDKKKPFIIDSDTGETYIDKAVIPTLTADMIDTRGLSIKDTNGNIILAAGTALDWGRIGGAGKPVDGATVGAEFGKNITGQITSSNVSTFIDNAAIGNAQIGGDIYSDLWPNSEGAQGWYLQRHGNLYCANAYVRGDVEASSLKANTAMVDTLNIASNAVSASAIASGTSITVVVPTGGAGVHVIANVVFNNPANNDTMQNVKLVSDGITLVTQKCNVAGGQYVGYAWWPGLGSNSLSHYSFRSGGTHTFTVTSGAPIQSCTIHSFILKR